MDVAAVVSVASGVIGGGCGVVALGMQLSDRKARKARAHLSPEMRTVLLSLLPLVGEASREPKDREWVRQNLQPLRNQYGALYPLARDADTEKWKYEWLAIHLGVGNVITLATDAYDTPPQSAVKAQDQVKEAKEALTRIQRILSRWDHA